MSVFIVTYNPSRWDWDQAERRRWERRTAKGGSVRGRWSVGGRTGGITPNQDQVFLLRVGPKPRGIIGSGTFASEAYQDEHWDENRPGELANYADVRWEVLLPDDDMLPVADVAAQAPGLPWVQGIQGSGVKLPPPGDAALERLWRQHLGPARARTKGTSPTGQARGGGQGWQQDPERRKIVENYGQRLLENHFRSRGWKVEDLRHGNSFDAKATKGKQVRYLEAKGTETDGRSVIVSVREVRFARAHPGECVLGIVSGIRFRSDGSLDETSGDLETHNWDPDSGRLEPREFTWTPPPQ